jgi:hypothetical protein
MYRAVPILVIVIAIAVGPGKAIAQTYTWLPGPLDPPGDWNDEANWNDAGGDFVPEGGVNENAQINNGGTAFVQDVIDNSGSSGDGTLGPGDIFLTNGSVLEIRSGALMSTDSSGGSVNGEVAVDSGASLRILGSGALHADILTLGANSIFDYRVTTATSFATAPATISGAAQLGGILQVDFGAGTSFMPGNVLRLVDASDITGQFAAISLTGNVSGNLGPGQQYSVQQVAGGNGTIAQLAVEQRLILAVNRDTMDMSISNPDSTPIAIDGYTVASGTGGIAIGSFTGLGAGWSTSPLSTDRVTQLRTSGTTAFSNAVPASIGPIFDPPIPTEFGVDTDDIQFLYTLENDVEVMGHVSYIGDKRENNLVLTIDEDGMATIQNESLLAVAIEGYTVQSTAGLLDTSGWNSLDEQNAEGGLWGASPNSDEFRVLELMTDGVTTFTPLKGFHLGKLYDDMGAGGVEDVTFQFLIAGQSDPFTGIVVFGDLPDLSPGQDGDFNGDGQVDAADYIIWRKTLGDLPNYNLWRANFGNPSGSGSGSVAAAAVPEPGSFTLLLMLAIGAVTRRMQPHRNR